MMPAASQTLVQGDGISVTANDLLAEMRLVSPDKRKEFLSQPEQVSQLAFNLFVRKQLAAQALKNAATDTNLPAVIQLAQDKYFSELQLQHLDATARGDEEALTKLAATTYKADPKRFIRPEELKLRHILIALSTPEAKEKAEELLLKLKAGADFDALAREHSADPGSASNGGDLGYLAKGKTVPAFDSAAFSLKSIGELSGVIQTNFGYHIIRLDDRRPGGSIPFEEARDGIVREIASKLVAQARAAEEAKLRGLAQYNTEAIKTLANGQK